MGPITHIPAATFTVPPSQSFIATFGWFGQSVRVGGRSLSWQKLSAVHRSRRHRPGNSDAVVESLYATKSLLLKCGDWSFDIFLLDQLSNGRPLVHLALHLFRHHQLLETFQLDLHKLMKCLSLVEDSYHSNPYHHSMHAADVAQAIHCFLSEPKLVKHITKLEIISVILAALMHDLDHPGVNQNFLALTHNPLSALYNNSSVLENHHWRVAIGILRQAALHERFPIDMQHKLESNVQRLILATDIARQPEYLARLRQMMDSNILNISMPDHRFFVLQIALKCADICNPCRIWSHCQAWSIQVCTEFFRQGDSERDLCIGITPCYDRQISSVAKIQVGFIKGVVFPLFTEWSRINQSRLSQEILSNLRENLKNWEDKSASGNSLEANTTSSSTLTSDEQQRTPRRHSLPSLWRDPLHPKRQSRRHSLPKSMLLSTSSKLSALVMGKHSKQHKRNIENLLQQLVLGDCKSQKRNSVPEGGARKTQVIPRRGSADARISLKPSSTARLVTHLSSQTAAHRTRSGSEDVHSRLAGMDILHEKSRSLSCDVQTPPLNRPSPIQSTDFIYDTSTEDDLNTPLLH